MYKMMAIDLDGTILNDEKEISKENIEWITKAYKEKDVRTVLTTGRTVGSTTFYADMIGKDVIEHVIAQNGAVIKNIIKDDCIKINLMDNNVVARAVNILKKNNLAVNIETNKYVISDTVRTEEELKLLEKMGEKIEIVKDIADYAANSENVTIVTGFGERESLEKAVPELEKIESILVVPISTFWAKNGEFIYEEDYVEFTKKGISKGNAIKDLVEYLQIKEEEIIIMGDGKNDISMFELGALKIAMGNGEESLKTKADYITSNNNQNGVAKAIKKYVFNIEE